MSNQLTINASRLNMFDSSTSVSRMQKGTVSVQSAKTGGFDTTACTLSISKQGREKAKNQAFDEDRKKRQEYWSQRKLLTYNDVPHTLAESWVYDDPCWKDTLDMMRTDEPETYAEYLELTRRGGDHPDDDMYIEMEGQSSKRTKRTEEEEEYLNWARKLYTDWYYRRCLDQRGAMRNPIPDRHSVCNDLENKYFTVGFDIYAEQYPETGLMESRRDYSVNISVGIAKALSKADKPDELTEEDAEQIKKWTERIDQAVEEIKNASEQYDETMKELSKQYGGMIKFRKFGVALEENGTATYYANYERGWTILPSSECVYRGDDEDRVTASSVEELLEKLKEKETTTMQEEKRKKEEFEQWRSQWLKEHAKTNPTLELDHTIDPTQAQSLDSYLK